MFNDWVWIQGGKTVIQLTTDSYKFDLNTFNDNIIE